VKLRKLLSTEPTPPIAGVIASGIVPDLVGILREPHAPIALLLEVAWCITNVASGTTEDTRVLVDNGALEVLLKMLASTDHQELREQAAWAIGNVAGDCPTFRDILLGLNAVPILVNSIDPDSAPTTALIRNVVWTISNLNRCRNPPADFQLIKPSLPILARLLKTSSDSEILTDCCWAFSYVSDGPNERIQDIIEAGLVPKMVQLLGHKELKVAAGAVRALGNIVTGDDVQTQTVLTAGALPLLQTLLRCGRDQVEKETCWTLSNILAGNHQQIEAVMNTDLIRSLMEMAVVADFKTRREATWALANLTSGATEPQLSKLLKMGILKPICENLCVDEPKFLLVNFMALSNCLKFGAKNCRRDDGSNFVMDSVEEFGGLDRLEALQSHPNTDVYEKASHMIDFYFSEDETPINHTAEIFQFDSADATLPANGFQF